MERQCVRPAGLSDFLGAWRVERVITNFRAAADSRFCGRCTWAGDADAARCVETGELVLADGSRFTASRRYVWSALGSEIAVAFDDGRPFHTLGFGDPEISVAHYCDPDIYDGFYEFGSWPVWTQTWRVRGPRKDYRSFTTFSPF